MSYLSMNSLYMKPHKFLPEAQPRNLLLVDNKTSPVTENNNQITTNGRDKIVQEVWSRYSFDATSVMAEPVTNFNEKVKMSWAEDSIRNSPEKMEEEEEEPEEVVQETKVEEVEVVSPEPPEKDEESSPSYHARRPMNAFLIFCKKHRPIVRDRYPNLENRGVTKILGEWWALLEHADKAPFTELAKEYKDAFLSAHPDFKWYKLPAPPLRTLSVRPMSTHHKLPSPVSSPTESYSIASEFTPGKLADESQLGSLTSLLNNNYTPVKDNHVRASENNNNNNVEKHYASNEAFEDPTQTSPVNLMKTSLPHPKPIKKRIYEQYLDNKNVARTLLLDDETGCSAPEHHEHKHESENGAHNGEGNMTKQEIVDIVVDKIFTQTDEMGDFPREVRKSGRQCKGKRYEQFMVEGRLLGNKRETKLLASQRFYDPTEGDFSAPKSDATKPETETPNLDYTIKRLAERYNMKSLLDPNQKADDKQPDNTKSNSNAADATKATDFNLDLRINNLPSLSYEVFNQRKRESKKRKNRIRTDSESKNKLLKLQTAQAQESQLVGSKKRKNKQSITHLEKKEDIAITSGSFLGLATLAEVAANTQKINEDKISQ